MTITGMLQRNIWMVPIGALMGGLVAGKIGRDWSAREPRPEAGLQVRGEEREEQRSQPVGDESSPPEEPPPPYLTAEAAMGDRAPGSFARLTQWIMGASGPDLAAAWALSFPEPGVRHSVKRTRVLERDLILYRWAEMDAAGMIEATGGNAAAYAGWVRADPTAALAAAREAIRAGEDGSTAELIMTGFLEVDPKRAFALGAQAPELKLWTAEAEKRALVRVDPREAALFWSTVPVLGVLDPRLREWVATDPDDVLEWFLSTTGDLGENPLYSEISPAAALQALADQFPDRVEEFASKVRDAEMRRILLVRHAHYLVRRDPEAAVGLARSEEDTVTRHAIMAAVGAPLASEDPKRSLRLLRELLLEGEDALHGPKVDSGFPGPWSSTPPYTWMAGWMRGLGASAPQEALELLKSFPGTEAPNRPEAWKRWEYMSKSEIASRPGSQIAAAWMARDELGFGAWLSQLPEGGRRDMYVRQFAGYLGSSHHRDLPTATRWAGRIGNEEHRYQAFLVIARGWHWGDPPRARNYFESEQAPPEAKAAYAENLKWSRQ